MVQLAGGCGAWFLYSIAPKQINGRLDASVVRVVILVEPQHILFGRNTELQSYQVKIWRFIFEWKFDGVIVLAILPTNI